MQFQLSLNDNESLSLYLRDRHLLDDDESIVLTETPGDGNMNCTVRGITTRNRSLIVKQSRPFVAKYPSIPAPEDRVLIEGQFYRMVSEYDELRQFMPRLLSLDSENFVIVLEDLGAASDFTSIYQPGVELLADELDQLLTFVERLHRQCRCHDSTPPITNRAMRELNALHIFRLPLDRDNGFDLNSMTPGLADTAATYCEDDRLRCSFVQMEQLYLSDGASLLHGDYYPGSWLNAAAGTRVIDPEFCFYGPPEFDLGIMLAHLMMSDQPNRLKQRMFSSTAATGRSRSLIEQFAGVEIIRRLIGLAQLPLSLDLSAKRELLEAARGLVVE